MGPLLIFLFSLYQLQSTIHSEIVNTPRFDVNSITESNNDLDSNDNTSTEFADSSEIIPFVKSGHDQTEVKFRHPIASVNIDYAKNVIILKFRKDRPKMRLQLDPAEEEKLKSLENNFMRFGKRQLEILPAVNSIDRGSTENERGGRYERSHEGLRDSRGDNFMRFGRTPADFMRFGRTPNDFMRFGRNSGDFMRFGRGAGDYMRFGRDPADFMRLGRSGSEGNIRFGRNSGDFMRFGRNTKQDFMRFGRNSQKLARTMNKNFMRFGRPDNFMRFGRTPPETEDKTNNFMRFGRMEQNSMMRDDHSTEQEQNKNHTKALLDKNELKAAVKLLHQTQKDSEESNPMDKAIKALFSKQQQDQQPEQLLKGSQMEIDNSANEEPDLEQDYILNLSN